MQNNDCNKEKFGELWKKLGEMSGLCEGMDVC